MKRILIFALLFIFASCENTDYKRFKALEEQMKIGDNFEKFGLLVKEARFSYTIDEFKEDNICITIEGPFMSAEEIAFFFDCDGKLINKYSYH